VREAIRVTTDLLRGWPLPTPDGDGDKEDRGRTLIVAGSREIPGAAVLSGTAALRAGAGKLLLAAPHGIAASLAIAVPESRVVALPEAAGGGLAPEGARALEGFARKIDGLLMGPGLMEAGTTCRFIAEVLDRFAGVPTVLDALAMEVVSTRARFDTPVLMTPHAGEMAHLTGGDKAAVQADAASACIEAAARWNAVVALKGATTYVATPEGTVWRHDGGNVGLATSGSGDFLAGVIAGLLARGASLEQAAVWGVALHARAGERLADGIGRLGYLARELAGPIPSLMHELQAGSGQGRMPRA
jgi:hydroxyethylthiazole kinase-like uncharacterized protein yjeF